MSRAVVTRRHACCPLNSLGPLCILKLCPHVRAAISAKYVPATWYVFARIDEDVRVRTITVHNRSGTWDSVPLESANNRLQISTSVFANEF